MSELDIELARLARPEAAGRRPPRFARFLAALPHLLFALLLSERLPITTPALYGFAMLALVTLVLAWRQGWPLWSGSWGGLWFWGVLALFSQLVVPGPIQEYLLLLLLVMAGWRLFQRRPLFGLLASVPPLMLMTRLFAFELVDGGEWIWSSLFLLLALISSFIVWRGSLRPAVLLTTGFHLAAGVAITLGSALLPFSWSEMGPRRPPVLAELVNDFSPSTLATIAITLAFLLLHPLWQLSKEGGRTGRLAHLLLLVAIAVATAGGYWAPRPLLPAVILAGLLLAIIAALILIRAVWRERPGRRPELLLPLLATFIPLVVFRLPTPFAPAGAYLLAAQLQVTLSYAGVILWSLIALWLILRIERPGRNNTPKQLPEVGRTSEVRPT